MTALIVDCCWKFGFISADRQQKLFQIASSSAASWYPAPARNVPDMTASPRLITRYSTYVTRCILIPVGVQAVWPETSCVGVQVTKFHLSYRWGKFHTSLRSSNRYIRHDIRHTSADIWAPDADIRR